MGLDLDQQVTKSHELGPREGQHLSPALSEATGVSLGLKFTWKPSPDFKCPWNINDDMGSAWDPPAPINAWARTTIRDVALPAYRKAWGTNSSNQTTSKHGELLVDTCSLLSP